MSFWHGERPEEVSLVDTAAVVNTAIVFRDEQANLTRKNSNCGSGALSMSRACGCDVTVVPPQ